VTETSKGEFFLAIHKFNRRHSNGRSYSPILQYNTAAVSNT